jgi:hypothetical protein
VSIDIEILTGQVLNFQLLRFVYDKKIQNRKKLTNTVHFPLVLDMAPYMKENRRRKIKRRKSLLDLKNKETNSDDEDTVEDKDGEGTYDLVSYLVHKGTSATGGMTL